MPAYYFDASVAVKAYSEEEGSARVEEILNRVTEIYLSLIGVVEVAAAFSGKTKTGEIGTEDAVSLLEEFRTDLEAIYQIAEIKPATTDRAVAIAERYRLRAYDCLQLATALLLHGQRAALRMEPLILVSSNGELNVAAANEGMLIEDPSEA